MGGSSSDRLFNRQQTVHQILGGGVVADVILWRERNVSLGILLLVISVWLVFERCGYTLLSLCSSVLLLLFAILFIWAKTASVLNRPPPSLPELRLSEEMANEIGRIIHNKANTLLSIAQNMAVGKDSRLFIKGSIYLSLISVVGGLADFITLSYACVLVVLVIPALYERYEDQVDRSVISLYSTFWRFSVWLHECIIEGFLRYWEFEKIKVD